MALVETPVRRRARGERRIAEILDAAAALFARSGVERTTTNAIAAEAGISPGSLYQFFRDKDGIAAALGQRFAADLARAHDDAFTGFDSAAASSREALDRILDPVVAFKDANPAFVAMFSSPDLPEVLSRPVAEVEEVFGRRLTTMLQGRNPGAHPDAVATAARTVIALVRAVIGSDDAALAEVKLAILGYLDRKGLR